MQFTYFVGVHVSKATLDCAVAKANQILFHQQVTNDKKGIAQFIKELRQQTKVSLTNVYSGWNLQASRITPC